MIKLFHVSKSPNLTTLIPVAPKHFLTAHMLEEGKTKRVSFAPTIQQCLRGVEADPGSVYYVYTPTAIDKKYLKRASIYDVPDARLTGEYWYLRPVSVRLYAIVKSGKLYGPKVFEIGGIEARRPKDRPLFSISNNREYELLKRYNKNGREMEIKVALQNREPQKKGFLKRLFGRDSMCDGNHHDDDLFDYLGRRSRKTNHGSRNHYLEEDYDEEESARARKRKKERQRMKSKLLMLAARSILF